MYIQIVGQHTMTTKALLLILFDLFLCGSAFPQSNTLQPDSALHQRDVKLPGGRGFTLYSEDLTSEISVVSICFWGRAYRTLEECDANLNWKIYPNLRHMCFYQADVNATMLLYVRDLGTITAIEFESSKPFGDVTYAFSALKNVKRLSATFNEQEVGYYGFLPELTELEDLALSEIDNVVSLANIMKCENLKELYIGVSRNGIDFIPGLSRLSRLQWLMVDGLTQPKATIQDIIKISQIKSVCLHGTCLDADDLRDLTSLPHLIELDVSVLSSAVRSSDIRAENKIRKLRVYFREREIRPEMFEFISGFKELEDINWLNHNAFPAELRDVIQDRQKNRTDDVPLLN